MRKRTFETLVNIDNLTDGKQLHMSTIILGTALGVKLGKTLTYDQIVELIERLHVR